MSDKDLDLRPPASGPTPTPTLTPRCEFCGSDSLMPGGWIDGVCVAEICLGCGTKRPYQPVPPSSSLGAATATTHADTAPDAARYGVCSGCHEARDADDFAASLTHCRRCSNAADKAHAAFSGDLTALVRLFRDEFPDEGREGDYEGWTTDETAARLIRTLRARVSQLEATVAERDGDLDFAKASIVEEHRARRSAEQQLDALRAAAPTAHQQDAITWAIRHLRSGGPRPSGQQIDWAWDGVCALATIRPQADASDRSRSIPDVQAVAVEALTPSARLSAEQERDALREQLKRLGDGPELDTPGGY